MIDDDEPWKEPDIDELVDQLPDAVDSDGLDFTENSQPNPSTDNDEVELGDLLVGLALIGATAAAGKFLKEIFGSEEEQTQEPPRLANAASKLDDKQYNIFISHSWNYDDHYQGIEDLLDGVPSLEWQNHSVPESDKLNTKTNGELKGELRKRMQNASVVLTSAGMYASDAYSKWIPIEHDIAEDLDKPVIAIKPEGQENIPAYITEGADDIVGWDRASVVNAVAKHA